VSGVLRRPRGWAPSALVLGAVTAVAPPAALLLSAAAGEGPPVAMVVVVVVLSLGFARAPESGLGLAALGAVATWWCLVDDALHPSVLLASVLLVAAHVAGLLAAHGPPGTTVDASLVWLWVARAGVVALAAPPVWLLARVVVDGGPRAALWQSGLVVALLVVVAAAALLTARPAASRP
jgi:hypothetical protein